MSTPTFIVGTGRCGSTMLSNMLREHPKVLSLSEFYAIVTDLANSNEPFRSEPLDGQQFWAIVGGITPKMSFALRHRVPCPEWLYNCDSSSTRFSRLTGVPNILVTTLPHLTKDHDLLFELLQAEVQTWPNAPIGEHYRHLFGWLASHFGKRLWVERSGAGLGFAERLLPIFPDARFVHVTRDGRDAALSMQKHAAFIVGVVQVMLAEYLGVDPFTSADRSRIDDVPAQLRPFLPERFTANALDGFQFRPQLCSQFWTQQVENGLRVLRTLPSDRLLTLRYEDFFDDAKRQLDTLAAFLGEEFVDEGWSVRCAGTVRQPRSTWRDLPEEEIRALTEACRPGFELLREAGVEYEL